MVHGLVGMAIDGVGQFRLTTLRRHISVAMNRKIIAEFEALEKSRDHGDVTRDQLWYSLNDRWAFRLEQVLISGTDRSAIPNYFYYELGRNRGRCSTRLLMIDLALRAYQADHRDYPAKLESLTPQYLTEVPLDPFSGKSFVYRPSEKDFVLYSVGGDGVDNGGTFGPMQYVTSEWDGYDLNLDAPRE